MAKVRDRLAAIWTMTLKQAAMMLADAIQSEAPLPPEVGARSIFGEAKRAKLHTVAPTRAMVYAEWNDPGRYIRSPVDAGHQRSFVGQ